MVDQQQYWAFISYSHEDRDCAAWLHRSLETYAVPRRLVGRATPAGQAPRRFRPIFCDREELAAEADLRQRIHAALDQSAYLIVVCSPHAAHSPWVEDEIVRFRQKHSQTRMFTVIVDGEPFASALPGRAEEECLPAPLREAEGPEPIAADLRPHGDGRRLVRLKLLAGMLGVGLDELVRRDQQRRQRQLTIIAAASLSVAIVMGGLTLAAVSARNEAEARRAQAEGLIEFMLVDLRKTLEPAGRLDALDAVGARAISYYAAQKGRSLDAAALGRRARVLHLIGDLREQRGDLGGALTVFDQAATSTAELLARAPDDPQRIYDHAQSSYWVGYLAWRRGDYDKARRQFLEYERLAVRLNGIDRANQTWLAELGYASSNLGTVLLAQGKVDAAADAFSRALGISRELADKAPADRDRQIELAQSYAWLADAEAGRARRDEALRLRQAERRIYERIIADKPSDNEAVQDLAANRNALAKLLAANGQPQPAIAELERATKDLERLVAAEPDNVGYQEWAGAVYVTLGQMLARAHANGAAAKAADRADALAAALVAKDASVVKWQLLLGSARILRVKIDAQQASSPTARRNALWPVLGESARLRRLYAGRRRDLALARVVAEAALLEGDYQFLARRPLEARVAWRRAVDALAVRSHAGELPAEDPARLTLASAVARLARPPAAADLGIVGQAP